MPTLIDQRILTPAPAHVVWSVLADSMQLPRWRVDCAEVRFLTARQFGVGAQRECLPPRGKAYVEEITAWYEGLGYEYVQVDNRSFREWLARIRLQAVPDGTIVQWTISYEPAGIMGRVSDGISGKARAEEDCANSLRQLRRLIVEMGYEVDADARRRQTLQPVPSVVRSSTQPIVVPPEESAADTKPRKPEGLQEAVEDQSFASPEDIHGDIDDHDDRESTSPLPPGMPESLKVTPPQGIPKVDLSRMRYADEMDDADLHADEDVIEADDFNGGEDTQIFRPGLPPPTSERDTGQVSIWEAFGVKAPSQSDAEALDHIVKTATGELPMINLEDEEDTRTFSPLYDANILRVRPNSGGKRNRSKRQTGSLQVRTPRDD